jgi:transposase InsO family protein
VFAGWIDDYNAYRPHGALGYLTPHELMGGTPGLRPSVLTLEPSQTT